MKKKRYLSLSLTILLLIFLFTGDSYSWSFYHLIGNGSADNEGLDQLKNFNPDNDILFLPPLENKTLFESINDLSICRRSDVRKHIFLYITVGRNFLISAISRSRRYINIINEIFKNENDIPPDISLLPLLESGFNPYAVSRSRAVGMWQFLRGTSRELGLKTDRWIDERRDVEKSTIAAVNHLKNLYKIFNCWELALTAYNGGAGHVSRAMRKSGAKNLDDLIKSGTLKHETSQFVSRYAALAVIYKNPGLFGVEEEIEQNEIIETGEFVLEYPADIRSISKISGVPVSTIKRFNPEIKKNITPPYYKNYEITLPAHSIDRLMSNKSELYKVIFKKLKKHVVKKGECLSKIAAKYNTQIGKILVINGIRNPHIIRAGQELLIPI